MEQQEKKKNTPLCLCVSHFVCVCLSMRSQPCSTDSHVHLTAAVSIFCVNTQLELKSATSVCACVCRYEHFITAGFHKSRPDLAYCLSSLTLRILLRIHVVLYSTVRSLPFILTFLCQCLFFSASMKGCCFSRYFSDPPMPTTNSFSLSHPPWKVSCGLL